MSTVQQRKAEILAKRAKLAELKKQRELRQKEFSQNRASVGDASEIVSPVPSRADSRQELDDLISRLVDRPSSASFSQGGVEGPSRRGSRPNSVLSASQLSGENTADGTFNAACPVGAASRAAYQSIAIQTSDSGAVPVASEEASVPSVATDRPKQEILTYSKAVQTDDLKQPRSDSADGPSDLEDEDGQTTSHVGKRLSRRQRERDEEIRRRLRKEIEDELQATTQVAEHGTNDTSSSVRYPLRTLNDDELKAVTSSDDFLDFVERSAKVIERALDEEYDVLADYELGGLGGDLEDDEEYGRKKRGIKEVCQFWDERWSKKRMISDLSFSPKFPELVLAAYTKNPSAPHEPDGLVQVWNQHLHSRPEYVFHSTSDILTAKFSPFHPNLIVGGSYSGQVLLWDTRSSRAGGGAPVQKTPLTGSGHTHPVYSIAIIGTQNAHNILTVSTDGVVCGWTVDMLSQPQEYLELTTPPPSKTEDLAPTTMSFPQSDPTFFIVGTEEGGIYPCHRYDRAGAKAGTDHRLAYRGHAAPVMSTAFHPGRGPVDLGDLMLSSSLDWSVKLWRVRPPATTTSAAAAAAAAAAASSSTSSSSGPGTGTANTTTSTTGASSVATTTGPGASASAGGAGTAAAQVVTPILDITREDVVYDARWSPHRPGIFSLVDGAGNLEVWDLYTDTEVPAVRTTPSRGRGGILTRSLNKVAWEEREGRRLATGGLDGVVTVFEVGKGLSGAAEDVRAEEWAGMKRLVTKLEQKDRMG